MENGLLTVELKREVPEELKPRRIEIASSGGQKAIGQDDAQSIEHEPQKSKAA
jgi:molecular chaperone IbpA